MYEMTDDSGFLALIDPDAYRGFVSEEWEFEQLIAHFVEQMSRRCLLLWGTGLEGFWRVDVRFDRSDGRPFREVTGPITASAGRLLLTNYESLTMAAQSRDLILPEPHQRDCLVTVPARAYDCRVLQLFDPDEDSSALGEGPDFVVELREGSPGSSPWREIPWSDL